MGTAPWRPYDPAYTPSDWRAWWDFGTGALGDMACHTANMAFMACEIWDDVYPTHVQAELSEYNVHTYPTNDSNANLHLRREYRKGWDVEVNAD